MAKIKVDGGGTVKMNVRDLLGRKVRLLRGIGNSVTRVPEGTVVEVSGAWRSGVNVELPACTHCGVSVYISKVHRDVIALVP